MRLSPEFNWRKYKSDFLNHNHCTVDEFEADYIVFMATNPDTTAYRRFARKYGITIHTDPNIPIDGQVLLSVNIAAIKVMAETYEESIAAINDILNVQRKQ